MVDSAAAPAFLIRSALRCAGRTSRILLIALTMVFAGCALHAPARIVNEDRGLPRCPAAADADLLASDALQCWFRARHGVWRTLSHESHYDVLVARISAMNIGDAREIAQRFVTVHRQTFSEILVYVQHESAADRSVIRRVRWTRQDGFELLDFSAPTD